VFKGLGNLGNLGHVLKQAMQVKERMEELKERLVDERVTADAGGGMVFVVMSGRYDILELKIDPEVINKEEPEFLETLVKSAVNEAISRTQAMVKAKMTELTGGIEIPGME